MDEVQITAATVAALAELAGLTVPPEDVEPLARALRDRLAGLRLLDELETEGLELVELEPAVVFEAAWE